MADTLANVAIVGGETPVGRELRDQLKERKIAHSIQPVGAEDEITGLITELEGEPVVLTPLDADRLQAADVVFCAGTRASTEKALKLRGGVGTPLVDLTYALEAQPAARLRAPSLESEPPALPPDVIHVIAHPAAIAAATVLAKVQQKHPLTRCVLQILEPASERGQAGMNELQQQTTALLTFQKLNKTVFDAQAGFNVLPRYGEDAPESLASIEERIERHLASLLASRSVPMPSIRLVQAPVFHGYSLSFWFEFENRPSVQELGESLAGVQIEVREADLDVPTNAGAVGESGVIVGAIELDRHNPRGCWLWAVTDNYRVLVDEAVAVAQGLAGREARG